jgi:CDP-glycerol glycerophosphotransferase
VWDAYLRLRQPGAVTEIRLKPAPDCDRAALWRTRLLRTAENTGRSCTPYITKGGYAALDTGTVHFTARTQLAFGPPVPAGDGSGDFLLRGRVGATGFRPGDLRCEVIRDGNTVHRASVTLEGPSADGLRAEPAGPEQGTESWPVFVHRLPGGLLAGSPGSLVLRLLIHGADFERELRL